MEYKDYYQIIGVDKDASQQDIKRAYRKLARKYHPDVSQESDAEARFKDLGEAYEVLKDPEKRNAYDRLGNNWKAGQSNFQPPPDWDTDFVFHGDSFTGGHASNQKFSDFFETLFGQSGTGFQYHTSGANQFQMRGDDSHAKIFIDLEDSYQGANRVLTLNTTVMGADGQPQLKPRNLNVKIPKGVIAGQNIRLKGQGLPGINGAQSGDLYLEIEFNPHSVYTINAADVSIEVPISPWEAALGAKINIPTPTGTIELKIPEAISSGKTVRLKQRGIPAKQPGSFYVIFKIILPEKLSDEEKNLYQQLQETNNQFNPRRQLAW
ncbi:MAG: DnaJ domain-containing protein [Gammaproteobacteria bacterium]|nr:DnaJ domain-containing protein [Gammaproteobacteria bacterium]